MTRASSKAAERPAFIRKQFEFAGHIRDPERSPAPTDVEQRRMQVYRELFYNNVEDFMANSFPITREIFGDTRWHAMIRDYFARHRALNPLFPSMPVEFLDYLENERQETDDPPFLQELAHYEWMELELAISDNNIDWTGIDPNGNLLTGIPVISPLASPLSYWYPVHKIGPEFLPEQPAETPTYIVVYRNRQDEVRFLEINAVTFRLLQLLSVNQPPTGEEALKRLATELKHGDLDMIISAGNQALEDLKERGIILGARKLR